MEDFPQQQQAQDRAPRMTILAGPNGSGKSTVTAGLMQDPEFPAQRYVNADDIARTLERPIADPDTRRAYAQTIAPNMPELPALGKIWYMGSRMSEGQIETELERGVSNTQMRNAFAAILADDQRKQYVAADNKADFAFETVMSTQGKLALFDEAKKNGFQVDMVFVTTEDAAINQQRVLNRVAQGGHGVDPDKIAERYHRAMDMLPAALQMVDTASVYDNSHHGPVLIARKQDGQIEFPEIQKPQVADQATQAKWDRDWDQAREGLLGLQVSLREKVQALQQDAQELRDHPSRQGKAFEQASIQQGSENIGRVVDITQRHVLQYDYEDQRFVLHDRSLLTPGAIPKLQEAMQSGTEVNLTYQYGPDSKLVDQGRTLNQTPIMGQRELDQYMFDPSSRESPKPPGQ